MAPEAAAKTAGTKAVPSSLPACKPDSAPTVLGAEAGLGPGQYDRYVVSIPKCATPTGVTTYRVFAHDVRDRAGAADDIKASVFLDVLPSQTSTVISVPKLGVPVRFRVSARNSLGTGPASAVSAYALAPFTSVPAFVDRQFADFGSRGFAVAPTAAATWKADLVDAAKQASSSKPSPDGLIAQLLARSRLSVEQAPIIRLYMAYFLRMPDLGGLNYWVGRVRSGSLTLNQVSSNFATSPEFVRRYGNLTNRKFVELIYENVLGRFGDAGGINYWLGKLDSGSATRGSVMTAFSESSENLRVSKGFVDLGNLYTQMLKRVPRDRPDTANTVDPWADYLAPIDGSSTARSITTVRSVTEYTFSSLRVVTWGLTPGAVGSNYPHTRLDAVGGVSPKGIEVERRWTVASGALPAGLILDLDGRIHGKPTAAGTSTVTFRVQIISRKDGSVLASATSAALPLRIDPTPPAVACPARAGLSLITWTGAVSDDWEVANNWSPAVVPGSRVAGDPGKNATVPPFPSAYPPPGTEMGSDEDPEVVTVPGGAAPAYDDYVCIPAGKHAVVRPGGNGDFFVAALDNQGTLDIEPGGRLDISGSSDGSVPSYTRTMDIGGAITGRGSLTVRSGATVVWHGQCDSAGSMGTREAARYRYDTPLVAPHLRGRTIVAAGATLTVGAAVPPVCMAGNPVGVNFMDQRAIINDGTFRIRSNAYVAAEYGTVLDNFGTLNFAGAGTAGSVEGRWVEGFGVEGPTRMGHVALLGPSRIANGGTITKTSGLGRAIINGTYERVPGVLGAGVPEGSVGSGTMDILTPRFTAAVGAGGTFSTGGCSDATITSPCPNPAATAEEPQVEIVTRPPGDPSDVTVEREKATDLTWGFPVDLTTEAAAVPTSPILFDILVDKTLVSPIAPGTENDEVQVFHIPTASTTAVEVPACPGPAADPYPCVSSLQIAPSSDPLAERSGDLVARIKTDENGRWGFGKRKTIRGRLKGLGYCSWIRRC